MSRRNYLPRPANAFRVSSSPSHIRRLHTFVEVGEPATRPCPHSLATWDHIVDPAGSGRMLLRKVINNCTSTEGHNRAEQTRDHRSGNLTW